MPQAPVVVLGGASVNRMVHIDRLPQGRSATYHTARVHEGVGSTGIGKAFALRALGQDAVLHAVIGDDADGAKVREACTARGVTLVAEVAGRTARHLNLMDAAGQRVSIFEEPGAASPHVDTARIEPAIAAADTVFLGLPASSLPLIDMVHESAAEVWVDLHDYDGLNPYHAPFVGAADVIQMSDENLPDATGTAQAMIAGGAWLVAVTRAERGATLVTAEGAIDVPATPAILRDSNGAGDAFSVGLWHGLRDGLSLPDAGARAAYLAAQAIATDEIMPPVLRLT